MDYIKITGFIQEKRKEAKHPKQDPRKQCPEIVFTDYCAVHVNYQINSGWFGCFRWRRATCFNAMLLTCKCRAS